MYNNILCNDACPVGHAPQQSLIAMHPLEKEKLDEVLEQGIIPAITEATYWVHLLGPLTRSVLSPISGRQTAKHVCLNAYDLNAASFHDN